MHTKLDNNHKAFFALLKAGLWETETRLSPYDQIDFSAIYHVASQQRVVGLVAAGLEHVVDVKVPQEETVPFMGDSLKLEQHNSDMNHFIAKLFKVFNKNNVFMLLVKGQGIAQCYERPLWRTCGDIDLLLDEADFPSARWNLSKKASSIHEEDDGRLHVAFAMGPWVVELHGTLKHRFFPRVNKVLCETQEEVLRQKKVRLWNNDGVDVPLPAPDEDVLFVFSHILEHFFEKGIGLRQICDWCRLLYTYRDTLDRDLLEQRLTRMGLISEWKAFAAFAVNELDMPSAYMPFLSPDARWRKKSSRILSHTLKYGNFGQNLDSAYIFNAPFLKKKIISFERMIGEILRQLSIFPKDCITICYYRTVDGIKRAIRGE